MPESEAGSRAAGNLQAVRNVKPLVHNITNYVVMNVTANALLAAGASPVMAHAVEEVEEMVSLAGALVLNIGTLSPAWIDAMLLAGRRANERGIPVILDPVGSGATSFRTETAKRILMDIKIGVVRGNASEVLSLISAESTTKGVDSVHGVDEAAETALRLAADLSTTLVITGAEDLVTDGNRILRVQNGHELMGRITGSGCMATALIGAFHAVDEDPVEASATALAFFGLAGERAAAESRGPGTFQASLLDALYGLTPSELEQGARIRTS
ncbi:MAG: hydroxyethylthiazole kinase [Deltaproteobacteria bacterium]|nr:hydroxyethylthiazole kinase [Deltaproteobacteria bacterium]